MENQFLVQPKFPQSPPSVQTSCIVTLGSTCDLLYEHHWRCVPNTRGNDTEACASIPTGYVYSNTAPLDKALAEDRW